jgi:hypothetical protein
MKEAAVVETEEIRDMDDSPGTTVHTPSSAWR